ncbi:MAG: hypothetical protein JO325_06945, partial [Solirubrobacterales bacterium]|nr:hypothetical protein [Solirubrobacterales bacterium]
LTVARRRGSFKVTPKTGANRRQPGAVWPALAAIAILAGVSIWGLVHNRDSATYNNASFALFHICVLLTGCWPALRRPQPPQPPEPAVARRSAAEMVGLSAS